MKQKIPVGVAVVIAVIVGVLVLVFGWHKVSGGADADVTQETIDRYQNMAKQNSKEGGAGGPSQMTHGVPPAKAPANASGNSQ